VTIAGGVVLDATPIAKMKNVPEFLKLLEGGSPEQMLEARIARRGHNGLTLPQATIETGLRPQYILQQLAGPVQKGTVRRVADTLLNASSLDQLMSSLLNEVSEFHKKNPLVAGISKEELRDKLQVSGEIFAAAIDTLFREKRLQVAGELVHLPGRGVVMKDEEAESKKIIEQAFAAAGLKVPSLKEVLAGLKVDKVRAQKIVTLLLRDRSLVKISDDLVFHQSVLADLRRKIAALKATTPKIDVARFKDLTGVSRKYAIPLLEYLDREHITRRVGDERVIL